VSGFETFHKIPVALLRRHDMPHFVFVQTFGDASGPSRVLVAHEHDLSPIPQSHEARPKPQQSKP
jgi:hypothetical protein